MTDREAIEILECMAIDLEGGLGGLSSEDPAAVFAHCWTAWKFPDKEGK